MCAIVGQIFESNIIRCNQQYRYCLVGASASSCGTSAKTRAQNDPLVRLLQLRRFQRSSTLAVQMLARQ